MLLNLRIDTVIRDIITDLYEKTKGEIELKPNK
jgi:hypothetical protein